MKVTDKKITISLTDQDIAQIKSKGLCSIGIEVSPGLHIHLSYAKKEKKL